MGLSGGARPCLSGLGGFSSGSNSILVRGVVVRVVWHIDRCTALGAARAVGMAWELGRIITVGRGHGRGLSSVDLGACPCGAAPRCSKGRSVSKRGPEGRRRRNIGHEYVCMYVCMYVE